MGTVPVILSTSLYIPLVKKSLRKGRGELVWIRSRRKLSFKQLETKPGKTS